MIIEVSEEADIKIHNKAAFETEKESEEQILCRNRKKKKEKKDL
ncbi:hypothetical protein [Drancourtella sp. An57]|nr:hypothetical protein [Drancourtella sp. An57]